MIFIFVKKEIYFMELKISGVVNDSIVDGPGLRYTIFTQGCPHKCVGCHNPQTHDFNGGYIDTIENLLKDIKSNPLLNGVTFSGGEPFCQAKALSILADEIHKMNLNVVTYTGYTFEYLYNHDNSDYRDLLEKTDILIDGPFMIDLKSLDCKFRGSSNQRIINVQSTLSTYKYSNNIVIL